MHHGPLSVALVAVISWIGQMPTSSAQTRADGQSAQSAISIPDEEGFSHFAAGQRLIRSPVPELSQVMLKLVVTPNGIVSSATPVSGSRQWYEQATALAMAWHFVPFQRQGASIYATFDYSVSIVPPEKRPEQHTPFPEVNDWDSVRITLQRSTCLASCPSYKLTIVGDGSVLYQGYTFVDYCGEYHGHVSPGTVRQLVDLFRRADYFNLSDRYGGANTNPHKHAPAFITSITFDNQSKSVLDEMGIYAGMPDIVSSVENEIDRLAGPNVWGKEIETHPGCWGQVPVTTLDLPSRID